MYMYVYMYIYIYREREREREGEMCVCVVFVAAPRAPRARARHAAPRDPGRLGPATSSSRRLGAATRAPREPHPSELRAGNGRLPGTPAWKDGPGLQCRTSFKRISGV